MNTQIKKSRQPLMGLILGMLVISSGFQVQAAPNDDIHREITEGKISAAMVMYLEAELYKTQAHLELELVKIEGGRLSHQEGKIVASLIDYIERSLDKVKTDLEVAATQQVNLDAIKDDIEKINELISEINS